MDDRQKKLVLGGVAAALLLTAVLVYLFSSGEEPPPEISMTDVEAVAERLEEEQADHDDYVEEEEFEMIDVPRGSAQKAVGPE